MAKKWVALLNDYTIDEDGLIVRVTDGATKRAGTVVKGRLRKGYRSVKLNVGKGEKKEFSVHRLVCLAFNGKPPSPDSVCRHLDDNKLNNHYSNLAWGTHLDNHDDRRRNGNSFGREKNGRSKLNPEQVAEIRSKFTGSHGEVSKLSREYGIANSQMWEICHGKSW